ncbi:MAG: FAD-dependent oxidoreductase [Oligoflexia bacterium]|nr:FAD-dependent oxidoreductase [Oligoflexia bacterium]
MQRFIENYQGEHFDVVIIGGGITGASVAYEAASKGMCFLCASRLKV